MKHLLLLFLLAFQLHAIAQKKYDAEVLSSQNETTVDKNNNLIVNYKVVIQVNNRDGEDYAHISIPYFMDSEKPKNLIAYITDTTGKVLQKLKRKDVHSIENASDDAFHDDTKKIYFFMGQNKYPYKLIYSYQQSISNYFDIVPDIQYDDDIPAKKIIITAIAPKSFNLRYKIRSIDSTDIDTIGNQVHYRFVGHYSNIIEPENYINPDSVPFPMVYLIPQDFMYGERHSQETWKDFGQWQYDLIKNLNQLPDDEKQKINKLISGVHDTTEIIKILYHYLQDQTRYVNVAIKRGRLRPFPASYVASNKYGDCKALSNYFKSILDYVGIPSDYTLIKAGNYAGNIDQKLPYSQFNHAIIYIPRKDTASLWLDCTSKLAFGYVGTFIQNRDALTIENNNSKLVKTPALKPKSVLTSRKCKFNYELNNSTSANISYRFRGDMYQALVYIKRDNNPLDNKYIMKYLLSKLGFTMDSYHLEQPNRDSTYIDLNFKAHSSNVYRKFGNDILVLNYNMMTDNFEKPKNRKLAVQIFYPEYLTDTLTYNIPFGYSVSGMRKDTTLSAKFGKYNIKLAKKKNTILVTKKFLLKSGIYSLADYKQLYQFIKDVYKSEGKVNFVLTKNQ